ncbi:hypothetical protein SAY87_025207 [Trapa incisa]|uniref:Uncharacterized protein n=1 Tax=Trapa incisa TaxID=236973 RepID=A0AAN7GH98_9MYRT|nr:hypothetical protein SAY87_025207 [Trapa incisa]
MEGVSSTVYRGLSGYWARTRRGYRRLGGGADPACRRRKLQFRWRRIKVAPRVKLIIRSPKRLLTWLRDAYAKMMMRLASSRLCSSGYGCYVADAGISSFGKAPLKEYDKKMIIEIYKSLMLAQSGDARTAIVVRPK